MCVCMCARSGPWQPWEWAALTSFQERTRFERQGELTAPRGHNFRLPQHPHWDHALPGCPNKDCVQRGTRATHFSSLYWTSFALQPCEGSDPQSSTTVWTSSLHILGLAISPLTGVRSALWSDVLPTYCFPLSSHLLQAFPPKISWPPNSVLASASWRVHTDTMGVVQSVNFFLYLQKEEEIWVGRIRSSLWFLM